VKPRRCHLRTGGHSPVQLCLRILDLPFRANQASSARSHTQEAKPEKRRPPGNYSPDDDPEHVIRDQVPDCLPVPRKQGDEPHRPELKAHQGQTEPARDPMSRS